MMNRFSFKPKAIKAQVENEDKWNKLRICLWSLVMASAAGAIGQYFDGVVYRSGQMQGLLWGGKVQPMYFISDTSEAYFNYKNDYDVMKAKSLKDQKYLAEGWTGAEWAYQNRVLDSSVTVQSGPNSDPLVNSHYFTQQQRYDGNGYNWNDARRTVLNNDADYQQWKEMTEDVIFFDTGACMQGGFIGDANKVSFSADSSRFIDWGTRTQYNELD